MKKIITLSYGEFMRGMCNMPFDHDKCPKCGGTGLMPVYCCNGDMCGCLGMPIDFIDCSCGTPAPTDDYIKSCI